MTLNNRVTEGVTPRVVPHIEARFTEWAQRESREMGNVPSKTNPIERRIRLADEPGSETRNRPIVTDFTAVLLIPFIDPNDRTNLARTVNPGITVSIGLIPLDFTRRS